MSKFSEEYIDSLLASYLHGQLSLQEQRSLVQWMDEAPANRKAVEALKKHFTTPLPPSADTRQEVWRQVQAKAEAQRLAGRNQPDTAARRSGRRWLVWAAGIAAAALAALALWPSLTTFHATGEEPSPVVLIQREALPGQKLRIRLADSSMIILNSASRLTFPETFAADSRQVELIGTAYFDVAPDALRPFSVKLPAGEVQVLGTEFAVSATDSSAGSRVAVTEGVVQARLGQLSVNVHHAEQVHLDQRTKTIRPEAFDSLGLLAWKDRTLAFRQNTFAEVLDRLELWYGVTIRWSEGVQPAGTVTVSYHDSSLEDVLEGLSFVFKFSYERQGDTLYIKTAP